MPFTSSFSRWGNASREGQGPCSLQAPRLAKATPEQALRPPQDRLQCHPGTGSQATPLLARGHQMPHTASQPRAAPSLARVKRDLTYRRCCGGDYRCPPRHASAPPPYQSHQTGTGPGEGRTSPLPHSRPGPCPWNFFDGRSLLSLPPCLVLLLKLQELPPDLRVKGSLQGRGDRAERDLGL